MAFIRSPLPFVLASTGRGSMIVNRHDYRMLDGQQGYGVGYQLLNTSWFDPEETANLTRMLALRRQLYGPGVHFVDCGANIGVITVEAAKAMHGWGSVLAFEAQERLYYALAGNIALNNCFNARAVHAAVGAAPGHLDIPEPDYNQPGSFGSLELRQSEHSEFIGQKMDPARTRRVPLVTLDAYCLPRVDLIKIDVEGMEAEVLRGAAATIERLHPLMQIEVIKSDADGLRRLLGDWGYQVLGAGINLLAIHESDPCRERIAVKQG